MGILNRDKSQTRQACPKCRGEEFFYSESLLPMCVKHLEIMVPTVFRPGEGTGPIKRNSANPMR
jgi:hypothetical protein